MKKACVAAALLLLLLAGALFNIWYLDSFIDGLLETVHTSEAAARQADYPVAITALQEAIDTWNGADGYTHIFIRHSEIDSATDAFYELLSDLTAEEGGAAIGSFEKLRAHLTSIAGMEHITFGSVF